MKTCRLGREVESKPAAFSLPAAPLIRTSPLHCWSSLSSSSDTSDASNKSRSSTCLHSSSSVATAFWLFMMITLPQRWVKCPRVYGDQLPRRRHRFSIKEPLQGEGTWWTKAGERWLTEASSIICKTQAGRDNRANTWKYMTAPVDVIRGVCEITAGPGLHGQHLEGVREQKGEGPGADLGSPQWCQWNPMKPNEMNMLCDLCIFCILPISASGSQWHHTFCLSGSLQEASG